jgi:chromosome partitioning protein
MTCLDRTLALCDDEYDYCLIDCPPAFNAASAAALLAADDVIIPIKLDAFSLRGMSNLTRQIRNMQTINPNLRIAGLLPTMVYRSEQIRKALDILCISDFRIFPKIRKTSKVDDMTFAQRPLIESSPHSAACVDYRRFVKAYVQEGGVDRG